MAEEADIPDAGDSNTGVDPTATAIALAGASRERADAFLRKQEALMDKQSHHLDEQLKQLRINIWEKYLGVLLRLATAFVGVAVALGLVVVVWDAANANGLVIEEFSVPPDLASRGITGQVVASQIQDRLTEMQNETLQSVAAQQLTNSWGNSINVQIPETGVSLGEVYRFLRTWLGHETHLTGEVYRTGSGIAITARTGGDGGATFTDRKRILTRWSKRLPRIFT